MIDHIKFVAIILVALSFSVDRGDPAQVVEYPSGMKPCPSEFFDPWSGVTNCE